MGRKQAPHDVFETLTDNGVAFCVEDATAFRFILGRMGLCWSGLTKQSKVLLFDGEDNEGNTLHLNATFPTAREVWPSQSPHAVDTIIIHILGMWKQSSKETRGCTKGTASERWNTGPTRDSLRPEPHPQPL